MSSIETTPAVASVSAAAPMSAIDEFLGSAFGKLASEKLTGVIYPQISMLVNSRITQMVNTGDRIQDGMYVMLANTIFTLVMSAIYQFVKWLYTILVAKPPAILPTDSTEGTILMDAISKAYPMADVEKFSHNVPISVHDADVAEYVISRNIVDRLNYAGTVSCELVANKLTLPTKESSLFVPLLRYTLPGTAGTTHYVFFLRGKLYGMHLEVMQKVVDIICAIAPHRTSTKLLAIAEYVGSGQSVGYFLEGSKINQFSRLSGYVNSKATFNRIFFKAKPILLEWLYKFQTGTMYPDGLCISNKFGALLYGPPGTGKTGLIAAMANHLGRHVLNVNSLMLDANKKFDMIKHLNEAKSTAIIVFDEFDYLLHSSPEPICPDSDADESSSVPSMSDELIGAKTDDARDTIMKKFRAAKTKEASSSIDMRFILRFLDGVGDDKDRIVVATTNHPESINPLFLRPGRFDVKLELSFCNRQMFWELIGAVYPALVRKLLIHKTDADDNVSVVDVDMTEVDKELMVDEHVSEESDDCSTQKRSTMGYEGPAQHAQHAQHASPLNLHGAFINTTYVCHNPELQARVDQVISLNITPLILINELVVTSGIGPLLVALGQRKQEQTTYGKLSW
jgi:hypothetical protein